jgi:uroporphyrinogen-III synthase
LVVYTTQLRNEFSPSEWSLLQQAKCIAFTSPSCVQALSAAQQKANIALHPAVKLLAIGPTTQNALQLFSGYSNDTAVPHTLAGLATLALKLLAP